MGPCMCVAIGTTVVSIEGMSTSLRSVVVPTQGETTTRLPKEGKQRICALALARFFLSLLLTSLMLFVLGDYVSFYFSFSFSLSFFYSFSPLLCYYVNFCICPHT